MIICDQHQFLFVHIPKCGGTSVRRALSPFNDAGAMFDEVVVDDPVRGLIDYTHLPLDTLAELFPEVIARFETHASFALCRDPHARFPSSVGQRLKLYGDAPVASLDEKTIRRAIDEVIDTLTHRPDVVRTAPFVHFAPQIDFVDYAGVRLVRSVRRLEDIDGLFADIGDIVGRRIAAEEAANRSMVFRDPRLGHLLMAASRMAKRLLPAAASEVLRARARARFMKPADAAFLAIFDHPSIRGFVDAFYARDIALHASLDEGRPPLTRA